MLFLYDATILINQLFCYLLLSVAVSLYSLQRVLDAVLFEVELHLLSIDLNFFLINRLGQSSIIQILNILFDGRRVIIV